jgi:uncharacterized membrane protein (DUF2068 family)
MSLETVNPNSLTHHKAPMGLRWVAIYEFTKGLLFLAIALGALSLVHKDVGDSAQDILRFFHLDPAWHYSKLFIEESSKFTDTRLRLAALIAGIFAIIRIVDGYGLWHERPWAEWFAVISAAVYVPLEVYHLYRKPSVTSVVILVVNIAIIVYLGRILMANHKRRKAHAIRSSP